jgi:hypothetical protein
MTQNLESIEFAKPLMPAEAVEFGDNLEIARSIRQDVRGRLRYDLQYMTRPTKPTLEDRFAPEGTVCYGYALEYSEQLERNGVDHLVGVVNRHATVLVRDGENLQWLDPLSPVDQDLSTAVEYSTVPLNSVFEAAQTEKVSMIVDSVRLGEDVEPNFELRAAKTPWLTKHENVHRKGATKLFLTLFEPESGREVVNNYARFREALRDNNLEETASSIIDMAGRFPDIDIAGKFPKHVKTTVRQLVLSGRQELAAQVSSAFFSSFSVLEDTRVGEYEADCLRYIATVGTKSEGFGTKINAQYWGLMEKARGIYMNLMNDPRSSNSSIAGKLAVCETILFAEAA